ncbi:four helix bundle protein [Candidatus Bipolaricaulota bacterium]|nr:four helix bundle protein [Candidatus Bipolaricaulota bacterium]
MAIERFEDIEEWKAARGLAGGVYDLSKATPLRRDFGLRDQLQRAAVSVMANIAEGFDSRSDAEFCRFLGYAYRSATEVQSHLYIVLDQQYADHELFTRLHNQAESVKKLLNGFMRYLKNDRRREGAGPDSVDSACRDRTADRGQRTTDCGSRTSDSQ